MKKAIYIKIFIFMFVNLFFSEKGINAFEITGKHPFENSKKYVTEIDKSIKEAQTQEEFFEKKSREAKDQETKEELEKLYKDSKERKESLTDLKANYLTSSNEYAKADAAGKQKFIEEGVEIVSNVDVIKQRTAKIKKQREKLKGALSQRLGEGFERFIPTKSKVQEIDLTSVGKTDINMLNDLLTKSPSILTKSSRIKELEALASRMILESSKRTKEVLGPDFKMTAEILENRYTPLILDGDSIAVRGAAVAAMSEYGRKAVGTGKFKGKSFDNKMDMLDVEFETMNDNYKAVLAKLKSLKSYRSFPEELSVGALGVFADAVASESQPVVPGGVPGG